MPCDYTRYPKDWKAIRAEVLERAGNKCEQCGVLNHDHVWRGTVDSLPVYQTADCAIHSGIDGSMVDESGLDALMESNPENKLTKIVLTISHTDHDITNNGAPGNRPNLKALCQRCHLRHDHHHHQANARQTRTKRKGMAELFT